MEELAEAIESRASKEKVAVIFVVVLFIALCALTAGVDSHQAEYANTLGFEDIDSGDTSWVMTSAALVLLMTPGVAFFYGGAVNHKNVISTMYQSFVAIGVITILWVIIGFSLAFGKDANDCGIIGYPSTFALYNNVGATPDAELAKTIPLTVFSMFQLMFAIITPTLISGSLAERINFNSWIIFICIWHLIVYCPLAHMVWHPDGILRKWGYIDFAGGIPVEMASGYAALAGAIFLGPRSEYSSLTSPTPNTPFIMLGTALFWFGWLGFNAGSAVSSGALAGQAFVTTHVAGAAAMVTWILIEHYRRRPASAVGACNGIVCGLVAITPACGYVTAGGALVIGSVATAICYTTGVAMKTISGIDDTLDVFAVHGVGGTIGVLLTGVFCSLKVNDAGHDGLVYGEGITLAKHIAIVIAAIPCIMISSYGCFYLTNLIIPLRVTENEEFLGLDISMHGESLDGSLHMKGATNTTTSNNTIDSRDVQLVQVLQSNIK